MTMDRGKEMNHGVKNFLKYISLSIVSLIAFCIIVEVIFRVVYGPPLLCNHREKIAERKDGRIKYVLLNNLNTSYAGKRLVTNSLGLRDYRPPHKSADKIQILVLGDSFTFGFGAELEETYPFLLESLLNKSSGSDRYEVINAGVMGYNTTQEAELLRYIISYYSPKWVIVGFSPNDVWVDSSDNIWDGAAKAITGNGPLLSLALVLRYNSSFMTQLCRFYKLVLIKYLPPHKDILGLDIIGGRYNAYQMETVKKAIKEISRVAKINNSKIAVFVLPSLTNWSAYPYKKIHDEIDRFCAKNDIYAVDPLEEYSKHDPGKLWVAPCDEHYGLRANEIAADCLFNFFTGNAK